MNSLEILRPFIQDMLEEHGHTQTVETGESLIQSGLLDSLSVVRIVVFMEQNFGIDFSTLYFEQNQLDSLDLMNSFIAEHTRKEEQ